MTKDNIINNLQKLKKEIERLPFDFLKIYEYYFGKKDTYYTDMKILLSISNEDALILMKLRAKYETFGEKFYNITQKAREMEMVERVNDYMNKPDRRKVVIFTGLDHMDKLKEELSKKFTVKTTIL